MEWTRLSLLDLPTEVIEEVVVTPVLSIRDVCSLCRVNWHLHDIISRVWGRIAAARWSYWGECVAKSPTEWHDLCRQRHLCEVHTLRMLNQLTASCIRFLLTDDNDLICFLKWLAQGRCSSAVLKCVLTDILRKPISEADLTLQFYALYAMEYLLRQELVPQWKELLNLPREQQLLETGAILLAQWMNPLHHIKAEDVHTQLDSIAEQVANELLRRHGTKGRERTDEEGGSSPKCSRLNSESGSSSDVVSRVRELNLPIRSVTDGINDVLYDQLGFSSGPVERYYDLENSCIDKVLERKTGIPISMCTVYQSIGNRLGITLPAVDFPSHFLLKFPEDGQHDTTFIDVYSRGRYRKAHEYLSMPPFHYRTAQPEIFTSAHPTKVFMRMVANIYCTIDHSMGHDIERVYDDKRRQWSSIALTSALSLQLTLCYFTPEVSISSNTVLRAALMCTELHYRTEMVEQVLLEIASYHTHSMERTMDLTSLTFRAEAASAEKRKVLGNPVKVKERKANMTYHVGMIMKHKRYHYRCVIYGWDHTCNMSEAWILQMGVDNLTHGRHQPFYSVLGADGSNRYASQENLDVCPPEEMDRIPHWEVGKYFCKFTGSKYIPNFALRGEYPHDV